MLTNTFNKMNHHFKLKNSVSLHLTEVKCECHFMLFLNLLLNPFFLNVNWSCKQIISKFSVDFKHGAQSPKGAGPNLCPHLAE